MSDLVETLTESFRSAAFGLLDWTEALSALGCATGSHMSQLAGISQHGQMALNFVAGVSPDQVQTYFKARGDDPEVNPRTRSFLDSEPGRCVTESDFIAPEEVFRSPIYNGLFRDFDIPHAAQMRLRTIHEMTVGFSLMRSRSRGEHTAWERQLIVRATAGIAESVHAAVALGTIQDRVILQTAEAVSGAVIALGKNGEVISVSAAADAILVRGDMFAVRGGRLTAIVAASALVLDRAIRAASAPGVGDRRMSSAAIQRSGEARAFLIDVCPMPNRMSGPLSRAQALLTIRLPSEPLCKDLVEQLTLMFGFTPAEAAVAISISEGRTLQQIAALRGSALSTIRSQLKTLFEKTHTRRQTELALLLRGLP